jgi:hypothetical protein
LTPDTEYSVVVEYQGIKEEISFKTRTETCCVSVKDFGAVGDGVTDSTEAIQKALDSGKPYIFFGSGHYLVNGQVKVPATVKLIDFMFCDLFVGEALQRGDFSSFLLIDEESSEPLCLERMYAFEQFCGHMRFIDHKANRELRMRDLVTQAAAMYVGGKHNAKVYVDNCSCTTGSYSMSTILARAGKVDDYYTEIPFEFHGQRVLAYNFNPERANVEVLNDGGTAIIPPSVQVSFVEGFQNAMKKIQAVFDSFFDTIFEFLRIEDFFG